MSIFRDPLFRALLLAEQEPRQTQQIQRHRTPVCPWNNSIRVYHDDWPMGPSFDNALSELQSVMENVNNAIGNYQTSLTKDLKTGGMRMNRAENGNLQVAIDVGQFKPEEIQVKLCDDNLMVEAKTETSENDSYHKAELKRWIKLPDDVKQEAIKSTLTPDRKLVIEVPVQKPIADSRSRNIPIEIQKKPADGSQQASGDQSKKSNGPQQANEKK